MEQCRYRDFSKHLLSRRVAKLRRFLSSERLALPFKTMELTVSTVELVVQTMGV